MNDIKVTGTQIISNSELPIDAALTITVNHEHLSVNVAATTLNRNAERGMLFAALAKLEPDIQMSGWYKQLSSASLLLAKDEESLIVSRYTRP